jgi:hypothetical protein
MDTPRYELEELLIKVAVIESPVSERKEALPSHTDNDPCVGAVLSQL